MPFIRGEGKNNTGLRLAGIYKQYKEVSKNPVDYKTFSAFVKEYNDRIMNAIIYENLEYRMPFKLGYIRIQKRKLEPYIKDGEVVTRHLHSDWKRTLEKWRELYPGKTDEEIAAIPDKKVFKYTNEHSNGYSVRFYWDKRSSNVKNQSCYRFKATRTAKESLAKFIKKIKVIEYFE